MSAKRKKTKKGQGNGIDFIITMVTLSVIFVFVGYLIGQYAVKALQQQHQASMQMAQERPVVAQRVTSPSEAPAAPAQNEVPTQALEPPPLSSAPEVESISSNDLYRVQVGVFSERANAERMVAQLQDAGYEATILAGPPYRVQTGAFSSQENASRLMDELHNKGFEAIIVR